MRLVLWASLTLALVSCWKRNDLSEKLDFMPEIKRQPRQSAVQITPFDAPFAGVSYRVEPRYDYQLWGPMVSCRHHDGDAMLHKSWNDHLNMADFCVVWQETALSPLLNRLDFWNGQFTCHVKTKDRAAWEGFRMHQLSNNHLISDDPVIRQKVRSVRIGDQIPIRGWLAAYRSEGGALRGAGAVRTDTGNGACETIYVREFAVIRPADGSWRTAMYASLLVYPGALFIYFWKPGHRYRRR